MMTSRRRQLPRSEEGIGESADVEAAEIRYPQDELDPNDVEDILEKLHIGTLRREQLKEAREALDNGAEDDRPTDKDIDDLYAKPRRNKTLNRRDSKVSANSTGSGTSDHSSSSPGDLSRQPSVSSGRQVTEMGIQTTLGKSSKPPNVSTMPEMRQERRNSKKDKMKRMFSRKSTSSIEENGERRNSEPEERMAELPQGFICKYMGKRATKGLWGSKHTRRAVEEIVDAIGNMPKGEDLPLVILEVHYEGLAMKPHRKNKIASFSNVAIPIQYISYGLQDTVYPRIFSFIMVTEMSSQRKNMEVHTYACDSTKSARHLAACLALAFHVYSEHLGGSSFRFALQLSGYTEDEETNQSTA